MTMRLQKYLAHAGVASRRKAEDMIISGRVRVNDEITTQLGTKVDPHKDEILVDSRKVIIEKKAYYNLNKPKGYVTTVKDERDRPTVLDLIATDERVYPVGRLDLDSRGLLLMTNHGELAYRLTHPSFKVSKTYKVQVKGKIPGEIIDLLSKGVKLEDGFSKPVKIKRLTTRQDKTLIEITLNEGRKRQIRRMLEQVGYTVLDLVRVRLGNLNLNDLPEGASRKLQKQELIKLKNLVKLNYD